MELFGFEDYKDYLRARIQAHRAERGYQSKLAQAAGCQKSFLSQVLNSNVHLTPDHALGLTEFWKLAALQSDYFMTLVQHARAATSKLKAHLEKRLKKIPVAQSNLANRFEAPDLSEPAAVLKYYSAWEFAAVHMLLTTDKFRTVSSISKRLNISEARTREILKDLEKLGLAKSNGAAWSTTANSIHLPRSSSALGLHLSHWRQNAIRNAMDSKDLSVHYSALYTLTRRDFERLNQMILEFLEDSRKLVTQSPGEDLACFNCDWFWV